MNNTFRFLPVALVFAIALLVVKAGNVWEGTQQLMAELSVTEAVAQENPAPAEDAPAEGDVALDENGDPITVEGEGEGSLAAVEPAGPATLNTNSPFTAAELDMLQNLALRREELDAREAEMGLRANLLAVTEARIEERIAELRAVETTIQSLLITYDEQEEAQLQSVVAIYEAMKPGDAANIFNNLDMIILIELVERMRGRLIAPILADMEPDAANALTVELATRRSLPVTGRPAE
jgi:flagellar motility protein MotE (MotC chaperone)